MADITIDATKIRPLVGSTNTPETAGAAGVVGNLVVKDANNEIVLADANDVAHAAANVGLTVACGANREDGAFAVGDRVTVVWQGRVAINNGTLDPTAGALFLSDTAGALSDTAGTNSRTLGAPESPDVLFFDGIAK